MCSAASVPTSLRRFSLNASSRCCIIGPLRIWLEYCHVLAVLLAQYLLVELAHAGPLQGIHKANIWYRPFGDGPAVCNYFDVGLDVPLRDLACTLPLQHDQSQRALSPFLIWFPNDRHLTDSR